MTRRTTEYVIDANNRDKGKRFLITEMDSWGGERWATRVIVAMSQAGVDIPQEVMNAPSFEALASFGINALFKIKREEFEELSDQLLDCVKIIFDEKGSTRDLLKSDIEESTSIFKLRMQVLSFHIESFFPGGSQHSA